MTVYLKLAWMKQAIKHPGEAYQANAKGGGYWDKYFWIMFPNDRYIKAK